MMYDHANKLMQCKMTLWPIRTAKQANSKLLLNAIVGLLRGLYGWKGFMNTLWHNTKL